MKNFFSKMFAQTLLSYHINSQAGNSLNLLLYTDNIKQVPARSQINKQIKVTGGRSCPFGHGAEQANIQRPVLARDVLNLSRKFIYCLHIFR